MEMQQDPVLMEEVKKLVGTQQGSGGSNAAVDAANTRAMASSLQSLQQHCQSKVGRVAYTTVLAAAAGAGEHTCCPENPCNPAACCPPAESKDGVSLAQRAESLGVRPQTFREARTRMHNTDHSIPPAQAVEEGRYCWVAKKGRSDAMDERVEELAVRYWHQDDISRASGDSGDL